MRCLPQFPLRSFQGLPGFATHTPVLGSPLLTRYFPGSGDRYAGELRIKSVPLQDAADMELDEDTVYDLTGATLEDLKAMGLPDLSGPDPASPLVSLPAWPLPWGFSPLPVLAPVLMSCLRSVVYTFVHLKS